MLALGHPAGSVTCATHEPAPVAPVPPQLARPRAKLPEGEGWAYEPKWDGFRAIAFVDGGDVHLQSRNGRDLTRYFPESRVPRRAASCSTARS